MAANTNKKKLRAPKVADSELSRVITDIYDELNKLSGGPSEAATQNVRITNVTQSQLPLNPEFNTVTANEFLGDVTGNLTGDVTGDLTGNVTGNVTGDVTGNLTGNVTGNVTGDVTGDLTGAIHVQGKNETGGTLTKGTPVYISGQVANGQQFSIGVADSDDSSKMPSIGVLAANVNNNAQGDIVTHGKLLDIDTSAFSVGDELFIGPSGTLVNTPPTGEANLLQKIAKVIRVDASSGQIYIMGAGRTNAVPNLNEGKIFAGDANNQAVTTDVIDVNIASNLVTISDDLTVNGIIITDEIDTTSIVWDALTPQVFWVTSEEKFNNPVFIGTSLDVDNGINADQHIHAGSYLKADTYLEVETSATIGTTLDVTGATTLSTLDVSGSTTLNTLSVSGNTTISGTLDAPTLNTGQGDNELYAMNQDVQTTDGVIFDTLSVTNSASVGGSLTLTGSADFNSTMNLQGNLTTQANLQDDGYATGWSGTNWQIQADGSAELQELRVRGALRVFEFIAKQISTIGGSEILSIAQGRVVSVDSDNDTITVENVTGTAGNSFKVNDLFICQVTDINNDLESGGTGSIVKSVRGGVIGVVGNDIEVSITSGNLTDLVTGDLIVAYGNTTDADRQAIMYRNVDRSEDNLIMRLQTEVNSFADLQAVGNTRVAFGDLNGYSSLSTETFGFFAGDNSNEHILVTNGGLFLKDGTSTLAQLTSNTFKVGDSTNFLSFNGTSFDIATTSFSLNTTNLDISSTNQNIVIGTGSALMTVGRIDLSNQGLQINTTGISNQNYWKLGQGTVQFKVGDGTNFLSFNENAGTFEIETQAFRLDTTASGGGIDIDSTTQTIKLEDANRVRTQVDVNDGDFSLTETVHSTNDEDTVVSQGTAYTRDEIPQITKGDSILIDVSANCTSFGTSGTEAYYQVLVYGGTTSSDPVVNNAKAVFSVHSYLYDYIKVQIQVSSNSLSNNAQFTLDQDIIMKSYNSQTRVSLDGVFVNNSDTQFARLTRSANELSGIIKLTNLPTVKPNQTGVLYKTSDGTLKVS
jgi:hypothetical protein